MTQTPTQNQPIMRLYGKVMQFDMLDSGRSHSLYMKMYMYKGITNIALVVDLMTVRAC